MRWLPGALAAELSPPVHGPKINPRFARGMLAFLDALSGRDLLNPSAGPTITGTRVGAFRTGTARGFGATDGVGSTDALRFGSTARHSGPGTSGAVSFACRVVIRGAGGSSFGRFLVKGPVGGTGGSLQCYYSTATYNPGVSLAVFDTGGSAQIDRTWPIPALGTPMTMVFIVYGGGNGADLWIGGSRVATFSAAGTAGGTASNSTDVWFVGNRGDGLRNFDGAIGHVPIWDRALTAGEAQAISADFDSVYASGTRPLWAPSADAETIFRLISDTTLNGWTAVGAASVAAATNEASPSDAEYGLSPDLTSSYTGSIGSMPAGTYTVSFRADRTLTQGQMRIRYLDAGNVDVGGTSWQALTGTATTYTLSATTSATATQARVEVQP